MDRVEGYGRHLKDVHDHLREQLAALREDPASGFRPSLGEHCLAFCSMLHTHHTLEDAAVFPALARRFPELSDVLGELSRDHLIIADILRHLEQLAGSDRPEAELRAEIDGLAAVCESHFAWEERRLVAALDQLT